MLMKGHAEHWEEYKHCTRRSCYWCELHRLIKQSLSVPVTFGITNLHLNELNTQQLTTHQRSVLDLNWLQAIHFTGLDESVEKSAKNSVTVRILVIMSIGCSLVFCYTNIGGF